MSFHNLRWRTRKPNSQPPVQSSGHVQSKGEPLVIRTPSPPLSSSSQITSATGNGNTTRRCEVDTSGRPLGHRSIFGPTPPNPPIESPDTQRDIYQHIIQVAATLHPLFADRPLKDKQFQAVLHWGLAQAARTEKSDLAVDKNEFQRLMLRVPCLVKGAADNLGRHEAHRINSVECKEKLGGAFRWAKQYNVALTHDSFEFVYPKKGKDKFPQLPRSMDSICQQMSPQFVDAVRIFIEQLQYYGRMSIRDQERYPSWHVAGCLPQCVVPCGFGMVIGGVGHWAEYWCTQLGLMSSILWMKEEGLI